MKRLSLAILLSLFFLPRIAAQDGYLAEGKVIAFDSKTYDFGDVLVSDGPLSCEFTFRNVSDSAVLIYNIISSCGCTKPEWPKKAVQPGASGSIKVTFANDQGPYPFDKTLTMYVSRVKKPVLLHIKGVVHEKHKPLGERFPIHLGKAGFRSLQCSLNYIDQGFAKSDRITIANLGSKPLGIRPADLSEGLSVKISPNPVEPGSTATLTYTVDTRQMGRKLWGRQTFSAKFEVGGKAYEDSLIIDSFIKEGFTADAAEDAQAPKVETEKSYYEFGNVLTGTPVKATFKVRNTGKRELVIHQIDSDRPQARPCGKMPIRIAPGASATIEADVETVGQEGESLFVLSLITNAPAKPVVKLFISGIILRY